MAVQMGAVADAIAVLCSASAAQVCVPVNLYVVDERLFLTAHETEPEVADICTSVKE